MGLRGQIVDLVGLYLLDRRAAGRAVRHIAVVQMQRDALLMRIGIDRVQTVRIESRSAADDAMNLIVLGQAGIRRETNRPAR